MNRNLQPSRRSVFLQALFLDQSFLQIMAVIAFLALAASAVAAQDATFHLDPQHTTINFTLGDVLHTVHGTFRLKEGTQLSRPPANYWRKRSGCEERRERRWDA